jgi:arabinose-5-phosphate isomerase
MDAVCLSIVLNDMSRPETQIDILTELRRVVDIEIEGLLSVRANLNGSFVRAVELLASAPGHVYVTGVGKSGIIANKIAATLRSTGTVATFLSASEALHGDLGVVRQDDVVLSIGKSGETSELNLLLTILKRNGATIISMTSNPESAMAALSDIVLDLKIAREACPLNLAPTTSTTVALALGDAIAVTLMKIKGISEDDFARHHPGGQLGRRLLLKVDDVMRKDALNPVISINAGIKEMLGRITSYHVGAISVTDDNGKLLGLVTDYDIRRVLESEQDIFALAITDIMCHNPAVIGSSEKAMVALNLMRNREKPIAILPVVDGNGKAIGMVHLHDLISAGL